MDPQLRSRFIAWVNWIVILALGPAVAWLLASWCGYEPDRRLLQVILLMEICIVAASVIVLLMVQTFGPWSDVSREERAWMRLLAPPEDSLLAEVDAHPDTWQRRIDGHLRSMWRDVARDSAAVQNPSGTLFNSADRRRGVASSLETRAETLATGSIAELGESRRRPPRRPPHRAESSISTRQDDDDAI